MFECYWGVVIGFGFYDGDAASAEDSLVRALLLLDFILALSRYIYEVGRSTPLLLNSETVFLNLLGLSPEPRAYFSLQKVRHSRIILMY